MTKRTTVFTHETQDDFTDRSIEVVRYTYSNGDEYIINVQETFEKDSNGVTESLSSINLNTSEVKGLIAALQKSTLSDEENLSQLLSNLGFN